MTAFKGSSGELLPLLRRFPEGSAVILTADDTRKTERLLSENQFRVYEKFNAARVSDKFTFEKNDGNIYYYLAVRK